VSVAQVKLVLRAILQTVSSKLVFYFYKYKMKTYQLGSGNIVYIGQNAKENFELIDNANPDDLWFHLKGLPSCHVVLHTITNNNDAEIQRVGELCLQHTKYRGLNSVYVEYLPVKYVKKTTTLGKVILRKKPLYIKIGR